MKTFAAMIALLLASAALTDASHVHITAEKAPRDHEERSVAQQEALERKQELFGKIARMKSTPWDAKPEEKTAKCDDICLLGDFWEFQQVRNCVNRPTSLCSVYNLGLAALDAVLTVAECDCSDTNSTSLSASASDYDDSDE